MRAPFSFLLVSFALLAIGVYIGHWIAMVRVGQWLNALKIVRERRADAHDYAAAIQVEGVRDVVAHFRRWQGK